METNPLDEAVDHTAGNLLICLAFFVPKGDIEAIEEIIERVEKYRDAYVARDRAERTPPTTS